MLRAVSAVPVIVATARDDDDSVVQALDAGADDYVVKPFQADQLEARIRAVLRRAAGRGRRRRAGDRRRPHVDPRSRRVTLAGAAGRAVAARSSTCSPTWPRGPATSSPSASCSPRSGSSPTAARTRPSTSTCRGCAASSARPPPSRAAADRPRRRASGWPSPSREAPDHAAGRGDHVDRAAGLPAPGGLPGRAGRRGAGAGHRARRSCRSLIPSVGLDQRDAGRGEPWSARRGELHGRRALDRRARGSATRRARRRRAAAEPRPSTTDRRRHPAGAAGPAGRRAPRSSRCSSRPTLLRAGVTRTWLVLAGLGAGAARPGAAGRRPAGPLPDPAGHRARRRPPTGSAAATCRPGPTPAGPPEVREVGAAVNRLAGRIGELLAAEREAAADLAHRLRTPLTALRLDAESLPAGRPRAAAGRRRRAEPRHRRGDRRGPADRCARALGAGLRRDRRRRRRGSRFWSVLAEDEGRDGHRRPARRPAAGPGRRRRTWPRPSTRCSATSSPTPPRARRSRSAVRPARRRRRRGDGAPTAGPGCPPARSSAGAAAAGSTGLGLDIARRTAEASGGALRIDSSRRGTTVTLELGAPA